MKNTLSRIQRILRVYNLVIVVSLLWFMVQFLRFVFPPLFGTFQAEYDVSNSETGILFTALMLAYSSMQFPAGVLGDKLGEPKIIVIGATLFTGAALVVALSPTYTVIVLGAILIGFGTGPHKTLAIPLLSRRYSDRNGLALGVMDTIGQLGGTVAPLVVVAILSMLFWQAVFILGAAVTALLAWLFYVCVKSDTELSVHRPTEQQVADQTDQNTTPDESSPTSYRAVLFDRRLLTFMLVTVIFTFAWNGISAFFPLYLAAEKGLSSGVAGMLYSVLFVASVSQTLTGEISDRFNRLTVGLSLFVLMVCAMVTILLVDGLLPLAIATAAAGIGFHGFRPVRDSYLMDIIPSEMGGGTLGIIRTVMTGIGALAPAVIGVISDVSGFVPAFSFIVAILLLGSGILVTLQ